MGKALRWIEWGPYIVNHVKEVTSVSEKVTLRKHQIVPFDPKSKTPKPMWKVTFKAVRRSGEPGAVGKFAIEESMILCNGQKYHWVEGDSIRSNAVNDQRLNAEDGVLVNESLRTAVIVDALVATSTKYPDRIFEWQPESVSDQIEDLRELNAFVRSPKSPGGGISIIFTLVLKHRVSTKPIVIFGNADRYCCEAAKPAFSKADIERVMQPIRQFFKDGPKQKEPVTPPA
jgi:hypothetical protein